MAIVSYVPKETQRTQGQWDGYHVIIWRSRSAPHTALSVTCATRERLQDGRRARQTVQIAAKRPAPPPASTPTPHTNNIGPITTRHTPTTSAQSPPDTQPRRGVTPPSDHPPHPGRLAPHGSPNLTNRTLGARHPSEHAPTFPFRATPDTRETTPPQETYAGRPTRTDTCRTTTPIPPHRTARSCTMGCDARESGDRQPSSRLDYCATHSNRQMGRGTMGRKNLRIVEYSAPEPRVPASEETRLELSPFRLEARTAPRRYPNISQPVSPHFPPIERIPVPVTPFPRMFRDDPEPA